MEPEPSPTASEPEVPAAPPEPSELVDRLVANPNWPQPEVIEDIIALGERAVGPLLNRMREVLDRSALDDQSEDFLYYGIGILGELKAREALPILFEIIRRDVQDLDEFVAEVIGGLGTVAFEPIMEQLQSGELTGYPRHHAMHAAKIVAGEDPALRARIGDVLKPVLAQLIEKTRTEIAARPPEEETEEEDVEGGDRDPEEFLEEEIDEELLQLESDPSNDTDEEALRKLDPLEELTFLVSDLADLAHAPSRELINQAFEEDLIDLFWVDKESIDVSYEKGGEPMEPPVGDWVEEYRRHRREYFEYEKKRKLSDKKTFQSTLGPRLGRLAKEEPPPPPPETIRNVGPKLGRNDPCWCGSGKKYKKCHLGKNERV